MAVKTFDELFIHELSDIYSAEKQLTKALPRLARAADNEKLSAAFEAHLEETEGQIERLQQVFEIFGKPARGKTCDAIEGIVSEGEWRPELGEPIPGEEGIVKAGYSAVARKP